MRLRKARFWEQVKSVIHMEGTPHEVAFGFGLGSLIGTLPIPFIDFFLGIFLMLIFPRIHRISLFAGIALWNPLTKIPIYTVSYAVGQAFFYGFGSGDISLPADTSGYEFTRSFLVGNSIVASCITAVSYLLVFTIMVSIQTVRKQKQKKLAKMRREEGQP